MTNTVTKDHRLGRCNYCAQRMTYVWHKSTGLRLDDVRCPRCKGLLDRTSREVHLYRFLSDAEVSFMRQDALDRARKLANEWRDTAWAWEDEMTLHDPDSADYFRCELNADRYNKGAGEYEKAAKRLAAGH